MNQSQMILCLILFPAFDWRKLKEQIAERRNLLEISIYQPDLYKHWYSHNSKKKFQTS